MRSEVRAILADLRTSRRQAFAQFEGLSEEQLTRPAQWGGREMDLRFILLRFADHEEEHGLQVRNIVAGHGWQQSEAQQILAAAQMTRGDLYGALVGLTDTDLDRTPPGEWSLRTTLWHITQTERSYAAATDWAASLAREGKTWEPNQRPARLAEEGDMATLIGHLDRERESLIDLLSELEDGVMTAPTRWAEFEVDVRFRLMRIAHHEREHTAQILKWRQQVGRPHTDAQRLLGNAWSSRGVLEGHLLGLPDDLLDCESASGDRTLRSVLAHVQQTDDVVMRSA